MSTVSRLPHIPTAEIERALNRSGRWALRVEVLRPGDVAWTNLSDVAGGDWAVGVSTQGENRDQPISRFTLTLIARADGRATSPGIQSEPLNRNAADVFAPLVFPGVYVRVSAGNAASGTPTMRLWLRGRAEEVEWPGTEVRLIVATPDAELDRAQITDDDVTRGAPDPGVPLATEIQGLLDAYAPEPVTLRVLPDAEWLDYADIGVGEYETSWQPLGPFLRQLAQRPAADLRYLWSEADQDFRLTLYLPPRDETTPRLTLEPDVISDVPALRVSREHVRNAFILKGVTVEGEDFTVEDADLASQQQFGIAQMLLSEGRGSTTNTPAIGARLLAYAKHDLAQPPTTKQVRIPFLPWITLHDVLAISPDDARFDYLTTWSVVGVRHEIASEGQEDWHTILDLVGGSPVGMFYRWLTRPGVVVDDELPADLKISVEREEDATTGTVRVLVLEDPRSEITAVRFIVGDGVGGFAESASDPTGITGTYEKSAALHPERMVTIQPVVVLTDGRRIKLSSESFDSDKVPDYIATDWSGDQQTRVAVVRFDSDATHLEVEEETAPGVWAALPGSPVEGNVATLTLQASTEKRRRLRIRGRNQRFSPHVVGDWYEELYVDRYETPGAAPLYQVGQRRGSTASRYRVVIRILKDTAETLRGVYFDADGDEQYEAAGHSPEYGFQSAEIELGAGETQDVPWAIHWDDGREVRAISGTYELAEPVGAEIARSFANWKATGHASIAFVEDSDTLSMRRVARKDRAPTEAEVLAAPVVTDLGAWLTDFVVERGETVFWGIIPYTSADGTSGRGELHSSSRLRDKSNPHGDIKLGLSPRGVVSLRLDGDSQSAKHAVFKWSKAGEPDDDPTTGATVFPSPQRYALSYPGGEEGWVKGAAEIDDPSAWLKDAGERLWVKVWFVDSIEAPLEGPFGDPVVASIDGQEILPVGTAGADGYLTRNSSFARVAPGAALPAGWWAGVDSGGASVAMAAGRDGGNAVRMSYVPGAGATFEFDHDDPDAIAQAPGDTDWLVLEVDFLLESGVLRADAFVEWVGATGTTRSGADLRQGAPLVRSGTSGVRRDVRAGTWYTLTKVLRKPEGHTTGLGGLVGYAGGVAANVEGDPGQTNQSHAGDDAGSVLIGRFAVREPTAEEIAQAEREHFGTDRVTPDGGFADTFDGGFTYPRVGNRTDQMWLRHEGIPSTVSLRDGGENGGQYLRVEGVFRIAANVRIPFDPAKLYRMRVRARRNSGTGLLYAGVEGIAEDGETLVNTLGDPVHTAQHYFCANAVNPASEWTEYTGYMLGHGITRTNASDPRLPSGTHADVRYFRPTLLLNWGGGGVVDVDSVVIDTLDEAAARKAHALVTAVSPTGVPTINRDTLVGSTSSRVETESGATQKAALAQDAAEEFAEAAAALARTQAEAYADGVVSAEEARAIADATAKAATAEAAAKAYAIEQGQTWTRTVRVRTSDADYLRDAEGATLPASAGFSYMVEARTLATTTDSYVRGYFTLNAAGTGYTLTIGEERGTTSNHPRLYLSGNAPAVRLWNHTSYYDVEYKVTRVRGTSIAGLGGDQAQTKIATDVGSGTLESTAGAQAKANAAAAAAQTAAQTYAAQQAALARTQAEAYADGVLTEAEVELIAFAQEEADNAEAAAIAAAAAEVTARGLAAGGDFGGTIAGAPARAVATAQQGVYLETFDRVPPGISSVGVGVVAGAGITGSHVLQVSNVYRTWYPTSTDRIPFDPAKLYRLRVRYRVVQNNTDGSLNEIFYAGVRPIAADGTVGSNIYLLASARRHTAAEGWVEYTGWLSGHGTTRSNAWNVLNPSGLPAGSVGFVPIMLLNYNSPAGQVVQVDMFAVDVLDREAAVRVYSTIAGEGQLEPSATVGGTPVSTVRDNAASGAVGRTRVDTLYHAGGVLKSGVVQQTSTGSLVLVKGYLEGRTNDGSSVTFATPFQNVPAVLLEGGITYEPRSAQWTGAAYSATKPQYRELVALNPTASGFTLRARLRQKGTATLREHDFSSVGLSNLNVGDTGEVTLAYAPSSNDNYRVRLKLRIADDDDAQAEPPATASITLALDTSSDGGASWVERHTASFSATVTRATDQVHTQDVDATLAVSGLDSTDRIRWRVVSVTRPYIGVLVGISTGSVSDGVTYYSAIDSFASMTPDADDTVTWKALAVS